MLGFMLMTAEFTDRLMDELEKSSPEEFEKIKLAFQEAASKVSSQMTIEIMIKKEEIERDLGGDIKDIIDKALKEGKKNKKSQNKTPEEIINEQLEIIKQRENK